MTAQFARAPHVSGRPAAPVHNAPHAALLIDFDNVTMGIRSDLTKELKSLLNSDIIKGKVAVQRAYADWRRYPQYIVPLAENSVDLIFAPAYGSSKKNATDIRLSIDALELVFTRPEIGTFILLSGDSDFSSLVLKLKEYGKYVIGVGIRESASDLLVQNCDEYYSYSALTGLTRTGDEELKQWDPWECVEIAVQRMADNSDVMRSDRLKQVILELDPSFDEKALGFTKFNRFLQEAANRGLLNLHKLENGQFEVAPIDAAGPGMEEVSAPPEPRAERRRRDRHRDRDRDRDRDREPETHRPPEAPSAPETQPAAETSRAAATSRAAKTPRAPETPRAAAASRVQESVPEPAPPSVERAPTPLAAAQAGSLAESYELLRTAVHDVTQGRGSARDSDVKRRILELNPQWTEATLGFSKFSRFLRQAHDAEVINLRKLENGNYEITLPHAEASSEAVEVQARGRGGHRGRGRREGREERTSRQERDTRQERTERKDRAERPDRERAPKPAAETPAVAAAAAAPQPKAASPSAQANTSAAALAPSRLRRGGSRGRPLGAAPPPLLPGQTLTAPAARTAEPETTPAKDAKPAGKELPAAADTNAVIARLVAYKGVGRKTAEAAVEAFGAANLFDVLENEPERVREALGARRAQPLLAGWSADASKPSPNGAQSTPTRTRGKRGTARKSARGTRGGKSRRRKPAPRE